MNSIRIVLKNKATKRYLGRGGKWTDKSESAMAFLDQIRASDYRIYHRLLDTEVVELAGNDGPNIPPPTPLTGNQTPKQEAPVIKAKKTKGRVPKAVAAKVDKPQATEKKLPTPQACEAPGNERGTTVNPTVDQLLTLKEPAELLTTIEAKLDVGYGNSLFVRGEGDGLRWDKGTPLDCRNASTWLWSTQAAKEKIVFKLLLNDQVWAKGEDLVVEAGKKIEVVPSF